MGKKASGSKHSPAPQDKPPAPPAPPAPPPDAFSSFQSPESLEAVKAFMRDFSVCMSLHSKLTSAITSNVGVTTRDGISEVATALSKFHEAFIRLDSAMDAFRASTSSSSSSSTAHHQPSLFTPPSGASQADWWSSPKADMSSYLADVVKIRPRYDELPFKVGTSEQGETALVAPP